MKPTDDHGPSDPDPIDPDPIDPDPIDPDPIDEAAAEIDPRSSEAPEQVEELKELAESLGRDVDD